MLPVWTGSHRRFPRFTPKQLEKISDIVADAGLVVLASVALPSVLQTLTITAGITGGVGALFLWLISVWIAKYSS